MAKDHPAEANPPKPDQRGSEKVLAAWKARALTEEDRRVPHRRPWNGIKRNR
jgi:hypothetical protein